MWFLMLGALQWLSKACSTLFTTTGRIDPLIYPVLEFLLNIRFMYIVAYLHCRIRIPILIPIRTANQMATLYYDCTM